MLPPMETTAVAVGDVGDLALLQPVVTTSAAIPRDTSSDLMRGRLQGRYHERREKRREWLLELSVVEWF
jgi:hypothetical protein